MQRWRGDVDGRLKKNGKIVCPRCEKNEAITHPMYGVLPCSSCNQTTVSSAKKRSVQSTLEYLATPFWKHAGFKPKPQEVAYEKRLKWRGMTYLDAQKERLRNAKETYDTTSLKKERKYI